MWQVNQLSELTNSILESSGLSSQGKRIFANCFLKAIFDRRHSQLLTCLYIHLLKLSSPVDPIISKNFYEKEFKDNINFWILKAFGCFCKFTSQLFGIQTKKKEIALQNSFIQMPLVQSDYQKPFYLPNCHFETILPALFRKVKGVNYQRERIRIFDGDFLDLDWSFAKEKSAKLVIISHGLEGDTKRGYIMGMVKIFNQNGFDVLAWNHRGCSGEPNDLKRFYHSGATEDLNAVVDDVLKTKAYEEIMLIGFSLGGNMTLKYLGEKGNQIAPKIKKAVVFSVPLHLSSCSMSLRSPRNFIYSQKFKQALSKKVRLKAKKMPEKISTRYLKKINTLKDFDDFYTAPLHGFKDAEDYYEKSSSIYFITKIEIPTLIVNAQNDPFLAEPCFPYQQIEQLEKIYFETPKTGGHCGFSGKDKEGFYWSEKRALQWIIGKE